MSESCMSGFHGGCCRRILFQGKRHLIQHSVTKYAATWKFYSKAVCVNKEKGHANQAFKTSWALLRAAHRWDNSMAWEATRDTAHCDGFHWTSIRHGSMDSPLPSSLHLFLCPECNICFPASRCPQCHLLQCLDQTALICIRGKTFILKAQWFCSNASFW